LASAGCPGSTTSRAITIRIDQRHAVTREEIGNGRFAAGDAHR
jgi:hypothetical protein